MVGQNYYFVYYVFEEVFYVINCYINEINWLYGVFDVCLSGWEWVVDEYFIVDMVIYLWIVFY